MTRNTSKRLKTSKHRISFWGSGKGSLLEPVNEKSSLKITSIVSDNSASLLLQKAKTYNIPFFPYEKVLKNPELLPEFDCILLAGFLKKVPEFFVSKYFILNIHPSLLPHFGGKGMYGKFVHREITKRGKKFTGVTLHRADEDYDTGKIFLQKLFPVASNSRETENKIRTLEKTFLIPWIEYFCSSNIL